MLSFAVAGRTVVEPNQSKSLSALRNLFTLVIRLRRMPNLGATTYGPVVALTPRDRFAVAPASVLRMFFVRFLNHVAVRRQLAQAGHIFLARLARVSTMLHPGFLRFGHHCRTVTIVRRSDTAHPAVLRITRWCLLLWGVRGLLCLRAGLLCRENYGQSNQDREYSTVPVHIPQLLSDSSARAGPRPLSF